MRTKQETNLTFEKPKEDNLMTTLENRMTKMSNDLFSSGQSFSENALIPAGYTLIKSLSVNDSVILCKENATKRHVVLKFFSREHSDDFCNESQALHDLKTASFSPDLYFALPYRDGYLLAIEDLTNLKPLYSYERVFTQSEYLVFAETLRNLVSSLHQHFNYIHGDLSPRNILLGFKKGHCHVSLVDWELAKMLNRENISDYTTANGTPGYSFIQERKRLEDRENEAVENCLRFFLSELTHNNPIKKKRFSLWESNQSI